ncbi:MAG: DUF3299 domain-containing protein [Phycisphaerales bacterium]|nr:DUF3299 domain-containing protein [Phycisphaerales bacterium]
MRTLWLFIAAIIVAGVIVFALSRPAEIASTPQPTEVVTTTPPVVAPSAPDTAEVPANPDEVDSSPVTEAEPSDAAEQLATELGTSAESRAEATRAAEAVALEDARPPAPGEIDGPTLELGMDVTIANATIKAGEIKRLTENELAVDGEWTLKGMGTKESPYEPSWEYLFSAADTYQPRLDENEIPQRIAMLDGKWIRVAGFTAFPLITGETTEMLVMLNKWDGCCIGVPPTPFDAIEVHLTEAVTRGPKHSINYGTITGVMKVDPYLIENWLVGLYILEESTIAKDI